MSKKVLVTREAGFIGSNLVRALPNREYEVTVVDNLSIGLRDNTRACNATVPLEVATPYLTPK